MENLTWNDFQKVEIRVGTIIGAEPFIKAKNPALIIQVDFGNWGIRKTSAQITKFYTHTDLPGKQVVAVLNFPPKQIANIMSECLILGVVDDDNGVTLLTPERPTKNGLRIG